MSKRGVQQLERGLCQPQRDTVVRLARALGLTPEAHAAFKRASDANAASAVVGPAQSIRTARDAN